MVLGMLVAACCVASPAGIESATAAAPTLGAAVDSTPARVRRKAVQYSDWYGKRLTIHRVGSYAMLPVFATQFWLGQKLISNTPQPDWVRPTHKTVAYGTAALFTSNTVTGVWNLWASRNDPADRALKWTHVALMLAGDAGFAYTGTLVEDARRSLDGQDRHRNAALASMALSTAGTALMWIKH
ncbi:MAG: hypothetical protein K2X99_12700 [Gemmatimonadaceae bacterium]|nr:hypothetical protein [Gemmatimonadaceae bacterium]